MPHLIELQDHSICVRNQSEVLARSPGIANIAAKEPVFGEEARQLARLHPRQNFNQFWSQLSLDPLALKNKYFRHTADLAHAHLDSLTRKLSFEHGAVIAAPSNYSRNQLAVLLGIIKQCSFSAVGLVDLALLQANGTQADDCIIIDLQLHQAVLTRFRKRDRHLVKETVVQVPASGLLALQDAWTNMIADEFIRQSRFDPQHNAETEQYVYNQLGPWLAQSQTHNELLLEINQQGTVHQARVGREHFDARSRTLFTRIATELNNLRTPATALHASAANLSLPGMGLYLPGLIALDADSTMAACMQHLEHIRRAPDNLQFVTRLPLDSATANSRPAPQSRLPTHVLFKHKAMPLPSGRFLFGTPPANLDCARVVPMQELDGGGVALVRTARGVHLELHTALPVLCNGAAATPDQEVMAGDQLQLSVQGPSVHLIVVE